MNPTTTQLNNRLNPTAVNLSIPGEGSVFRSSGPTADSVYMIKDGKLQQIGLQQLGLQVEQAAGRLTMTPYGWDGPATHVRNGLESVGINELSKIGVDWNSIPQIPEGQIADLSGLVRDGKLGTSSLNLDDLKSALTQTPAQATSVTINNTPNKLATPPQNLGNDPQSGLPYVNPNAPQGPYGVQGAGASLGASNGASGSASSAPDLSGLPPGYADLYNQLETYLKKLQANGQVLNPNIQIDPSQTATFLAQAHNEIDPYYSGQLKLAIDTLSKSVNYATGTQANNEANAQTKYGRDLSTLQGNLADQGFSQSGIRNKQENNLAEDTQNTIDEGRRTLAYNIGNASNTFAQKYGSASAPSFSMGASPRVLAGESKFDTSGPNSNLYTLSPNVYDGLVGSEQYQQRADVSNRSSQLESAFRTTQGINQARALTI
jgi:hypothetical protein